MNTANGTTGVAIDVNGEPVDEVTIFYSRVRDRWEGVDAMLPCGKPRGIDLFFGAIKGPSGMIEKLQHQICTIVVRHSDGEVDTIERTHFDSFGHFGARRILFGGIEA